MADTPSSLPVLVRPKAEFRTEEQLRSFCNDTSGRLDEYVLDISLAAAQLQKYLGQIPDGTGIGLASKIRAKFVIAHLRTCARVLDVASGYSAGTWVAYCRYFAKERGA
jgi:hypothetical protein